MIVVAVAAVFVQFHLVWLHRLLMPLHVIAAQLLGFQLYLRGGYGDDVVVDFACYNHGIVVGDDADCFSASDHRASNGEQCAMLVLRTILNLDPRIDATFAGFWVAFALLQLDALMCRDSRVMDARDQEATFTRARQTQTSESLTPLASAAATSKATRQHKVTLIQGYRHSA